VISILKQHLCQRCKYPNLPSHTTKVLKMVKNTLLLLQLV